MKVKREKRNGVEVVRITSSVPQIIQDDQERYYFAYITVFVIEEKDGTVLIARSEVDNNLMEVHGKKKKAFRRSEDDLFLEHILKKTE